MRALVACVLGLACTADSPGAASVDAVPPGPDAAGPDRFAGLYDDPDDFSRVGCTPGALAGFGLADLWPELGLRTALVGGVLRVYAATFGDEDLVAHLLTADDLLVRVVASGRDELNAYDVCAIDAGGVLRGHHVRCVDDPADGGGALDCRERPFAAEPHRRIAGESDGLHLTLLGEVGAAWPRRIAGAEAITTNVRVDGEVAFVSRGADGLRIVSVRDPAAPVELAHVEGGWANDVKLVRHASGRRYAVSGSAPVMVVDVTTPAAPQLVAQLAASAHSLFVEGHRVYTVDGTSPEVRVFDLSTPASPRLLGAWTAPYPAAWHDLFVEHGVAHLSDIDGSGLHVVDLSDPAAPRGLVAEPPSGRSSWHSPWVTTFGGRRVVVHGTEFDQPGIRLLDGTVGSATYLHTLSEWSLRDGADIRYSTHNVMALGPTVYAAHYRDGVRVLDISDPAAPVMIGYFNTWRAGAGTAGDLGTFGLDLDPTRRRIYLADSVRGLVILQGDATVFPGGG